MRGDTMTNRVLKSLLLTVLVAGLSAAQVANTKSGIFLRTTIETYPEVERGPILNYLDGARIVADKVIRNFAAERDVELVGEFANLERVRGQRIDVRDYANRVRRTYGSVTSFSFRCQVLEAPAEKPNVNDAQRAKSIVYYSITTAKRPNGDLYLTVKTMLIGNSHAASYLSIDNYGGKTMPCLQGKQANSK
jgi:hypothetical protein